MRRIHLFLNLPESGQDTPPGLKRLLARSSRITNTTHSGLIAPLCQLFGLEDENLAPITLKAEGMDPSQNTWFRADPVHLHLGLTSLSLMDSRAFQLNHDESAALIDTLNSHFSGDLRLVSVHPLRWHVCFSTPPRVNTRHLDQVAGTTMETNWVTGPDAGRLQSLSNEIQMLLYEHPVNQAREARGERPINGVWFWGGGMYRTPKAELALVMADDFESRALAHDVGIPCQSLPTQLVPAKLPVGKTLLVSTLPQDWTKRDIEWLKPILSALQMGVLTDITLTTTGFQGKTRQLTRFDAWKLWR